MLEENEQNSHLVKCFNLASSFLKLAKDLQDEFHKRKISTDTASQGVLCFLLAKNLTTAEAVIILCRERYPKDALILVRTIFEAALWVLDIFKEQAESEERALAYIKYEAIDRKKTSEKVMELIEQQLKEIKNMIEENNVIIESERKRILESQQQYEKFREDLIQYLRKTEREVIEIENEYKEKKYLLSYGEKKVSQLAYNAGLLSFYYSFYRESSLYAHNRAKSSISFVEESEEGWNFCWGPDTRGREDVLIHLCHFLWYIVKEFNKYFELGHDEIISQKGQEVEELFGLALTGK